MECRYCHNKNFEDFAYGRAIYHKSGMTNFLVRLIQEIYGHCLSYLQDQDNVCIYDPCCGGYLLTVLGLLNIGSIKRIVGSDISDEAVDLAWQYLSLFTEEGLDRRIKQLEDYYIQFRKTSHEEAIKSAKRLMDIIKEYDAKPSTSIFKGGILSKDTLEAQELKQI